MKKSQAVQKIERVMHEYGKGMLHSSSGEMVKNPKQAYAIARSQAGMPMRKKKK